jgi:MoaA/NifB/PqqE/SkfB family radical SAM enzyme
MLLDGTIPEADLRARTLARPVLFRGLCCPSVGRLAFLNPYGEVFPCHYAEFSNQEFGQWAALRQRFMMGSVRDSSFGEVWHGERYASFRRRISPIREDDEELCTVCAQCSELCASAAPARLRGAAR